MFCIESDLSATGDFKVSNYGFNSVNTHQHCKYPVLFRIFFYCMSLLSLASLSNLLAAGCGYEHFWTWTKQLHFSHFFFLPVIEKLQHLFTFQHLGVSAVAQHYSILNTQRRIETAVSISSATQSHTLLHNGQWGLWTVWFHSSYFGFRDKKNP